MNENSIRRSMHEVEVIATWKASGSQGALLRRPGTAVAGAGRARRLARSRLAGQDLPETCDPKAVPAAGLGPLPERPDRLGEFVMIATSYGNRDHWWIRPES